MECGASRNLVLGYFSADALARRLHCTDASAVLKSKWSKERRKGQIAGSEKNVVSLSTFLHIRHEKEFL